MLLEQRARTRALGTLLAQDVILLRRQLRPPLRVGLFDLEFLRGLCRGTSQPAEGREPKQTGDRGEQNTAVNHDGLRLKRNYQTFAHKYGRRRRKLHRTAGIFLTL